MKSSELKRLLYQTFGDLADDQLLALAMYGEARGESMEGKVAMGSVVLERVDHRDWDGKTIKEVLLLNYQFSAFLPNDPNFKQLALIASDFDAALMKSAALSVCYDVARGLLNGTIPRDPIIAAHNICQYKVIGCPAAWADKMRLVATIGAHEFYA
jgi:N-acetylmuramoyl-L-alanine amidase